ncbi:MAG: streptogrisin [Actinomycetota bacterium]|nr:streptogrisin [Actinomycetota bacterium]
MPEMSGTIRIARGRNAARRSPGQPRRSVLVVGAGATAILASLGPIAWNAASANPSTPVPAPAASAPATAPVAPTVQDAAAAFLMGEFGIPRAEAQRRLALQARQPGIEAGLAKRYPDEFAGTWVDQAHGGVLVVQSTNPERMRSHLAGLPEARHLRTERAAWSLRSLERDRQVVEKRLGRVGEVYSVDVDRDANALRVVYARGSKGQLAQRSRRAAEAIADVTVPVTARAAAPATGQGLKSCTSTNCDPPLRGGIRLDIKRSRAGSDRDPWWGSCTLGFVLRGSDNRRYVVTAGHCVSGPNHEGNDHAFHNGLPVGNEAGMLTYDQYPTDYAIMPVGGPSLPNDAFWSGYWVANRRGVGTVLINCAPQPFGPGCGPASGSSHTTGSDFHLQGVAGAIPQQGRVVCTTGAGDNASYRANDGYTPGTRCGLTGAPYDQDRARQPVPGWHYQEGGITVDVCAREGDSGSPLFDPSTGLALGILTGGPETSGACSSSSLEWNQYSPLYKILDHARTQSGITFSLITS